MAKAQGVSKATINRIWQSHHLQPHRTKNFKLSWDPKFLEKLFDVVNLYLNPPEKALVLCVDEKSQIQALDRTQPGLPMKKGRCGTMTHDYKRHGTTTLFAALEILVFDTIVHASFYGFNVSHQRTALTFFGAKRPMYAPRRPKAHRAEKLV
jgi:hypothetical protein